MGSSTVVGVGASSYSKAWAGFVKGIYQLSLKGVGISITKQVIKE
jgi:hypothetical protein